ncbi:uncharacterized protein LAESUDRAFT_721574 [Laetiporus sulphureus 93-53]|uniref:Uncharacterized protein n=1 Tax=Laetiporus sulphureus 93-53 TaxID=1314785 RepID=A0A165GEG0_9APHY|nr:uncharacterized protein LAESUDRAFT_721574 [Laetiporus sulphureus 93-53]KZT10236.1 hypothetical protein LAESUDRAFT_721574 [Laetiporus sulphureus 93-53]
MQSMLSPLSQPTLSARAAEKARAADVGIRTRIVHDAPEYTREPAAFQPTSSHRLSLPQLDLRPNEIREAWNAQQMASMTQPVSKPQVRGRPSPADLQHGNMYVNWVRKGIIARIPHMQEKEVPSEQEEEYRQTFDVLWGYVFEMDPLLQVYACWMAEETIRQLITITTVVKQQKAYFSSHSPRRIMDLPSVGMFLHVVQKIREAIAEKQKALVRQLDPAALKSGHVLHLRSPSAGTTVN